MRAFSTFNILPRSGKIAWNSLFLPCFADPPALSPSTIYNSVFDGSRLEQSASLPGSADDSSSPFRLVSSRAFLAASRARLALIDFQ